MREVFVVHEWIVRSDVQADSFFDHHWKCEMVLYDQRQRS